MERRVRNKKGFTLVEAMLAVALSSFMILAIFGIFQVGNEQSQLSQTKMLLEDSVRESLYKIVQEIRQSAPSRITISGDGTSITMSVPNPDDLVDDNYDVKWDSAHTITYALGGISDRQFLRTDETDGLTAVIGNDITDVEFIGNAAAPTVVTITLSAQRTLISGRQVPSQPLTMTAEAEVRNP